MQRTSLSTLSARLATGLSAVFANPWRRLVVLLMAALSGFFTSTVYVTTAGQRGALDITMAAIAVVLVEGASFYVYGSRGPRAFFVPILNFLKLGFAYGCFLQALVLGS